MNHLLNTFDPATIGDRHNGDSDDENDEGHHDDNSDDDDEADDGEVEDAENQEINASIAEDEILIGKRRKTKVRRMAVNPSSIENIFKVGKMKMEAKNLTVVHIRRNARKTRKQDLKKEIYDAVVGERGDGVTSTTLNALEKLDMDLT